MKKSKYFNNKRDHITIPQSTLRWFCPTDGYKISFLDLDSKEITEKGASQYHKQLNYYPQEFDKICQSLETWLGNLRHKIHENETNGYSTGYDVSLLTENAKKLIALHSVREPETLNLVMDGDWWQKELNDCEALVARLGMLNTSAVKTIKNFRMIYSTNQAKRDFFYSDDIAQRHYHVFLEKLENHEAAIVRISSEIASTFLLTPFHFTQIGDSFHFVLTPRYAILLCSPKTYGEMFSLDGIIHNMENPKNLRLIYEIKDTESVEFIYEYDIKMAMKAANKHLIGEKNVLEKIRFRLKS